MLSHTITPPASRGAHLRPLRIAIPIHRPCAGGVERVAYRLARAWERAGHEVTIVLGRKSTATAAENEPLRCWQIPTRWSTATWQTPWLVYSLYSFLMANRTDVLFCPGNTYAVVGAAMKVLMGEHAPPMVLKVSNALHRPDMPFGVRQGYGAWLRTQGGLFDRLIGLSDAMNQEIHRLTCAEPGQLRCIPNPILENGRRAALAALPRAPRSVWSLHYLAAGRLVTQKNYPLLLRAFARAARPHDRLTIAGDGPERASLERLCAGLGISERVHLVGHVESIDPLLAVADAFVLSSTYEGLPGVIVEALAAGLPILATDCCVSMKELLDPRKTGLLVPPGRDDAFAQGLIALRHFENDRQRARQTAARYGVEGTAALYIDMLHELLDQRIHPTPFPLASGLANSGSLTNRAH